MTAYMIAHLRKSDEVHPNVLKYISQVQSTLDPFGGRFIVHGGTVEVFEGSWPGDVVMVEFPSMQHARDFYASPAYREILPLRTEHLAGDLIIVDGVAPGFATTAKAAAIAEATGLQI